MIRHLDIVGDVHGHADVLERLLRQMGYQPHGKGYRRSGHQLVLVGDLIDRGPQQRRVLEIVRTMRDAGDAQVVMGNHEFNALCYAAPDGRGGYVRPHHTVNNHQHEAFLAEFPFGSDAHAEALEFFRSLPVWLDLGGVRVIHACWHEPSMRLLEDRLQQGMTDELLLAYGERGDVYDALEILLKGPEAHLPDGVVFHDKDGHRRRRARVNWWQLHKGSPDAFALPADLLAGQNMQASLERAACYAYQDSVPLFFGHYWQRNFTPPTLTSADGHAWCLDYSVARGGQLVAATVNLTDGQPGRCVAWHAVSAVAP